MRSLLCIEQCRVGTPDTTHWNIGKCLPKNNTRCINPIHLVFSGGQVFPPDAALYLASNLIPFILPAITSLAIALRNTVNLILRDRSQEVAGLNECSGFHWVP